MSRRPTSADETPFSANRGVSLGERKDIEMKHGICLYGESGSGKTAFAGTIAKVPHIEEVLWLDLESGVGALTAKSMPPHLRLTPEELAKIVPITISDTQKNTRAASTVTALMTTTDPLWIDPYTGEIIAEPLRGSAISGDAIMWEPIHLLPPKVAIVIDSGSQLTTSIIAFYKKKELDGFKLWDQINYRMNAIFSAIQAAPVTVIFITHTVPDEAEMIAASGGTKPNPRALITGRKTQHIPIAGSKNFGANVGRFFRHKLYCGYLKGKYYVVSTPGALDFTMPTNRSGIEFERIENPTLEEFWK